MRAIGRFMRNNLLLTGVLFTYIVLAIVRKDLALNAFNKSLYYVIEMLEVLPAVFVLVSLIEAWVPREAIVKSFGSKSGIKGNTVSLLIGSLSAGPIYAAFPVCKTLLKKGASIENIVIILSAWAVIKVPMLLNEAQFLGTRFMILRWVFTVIMIFSMAYLFKLLAVKGLLKINVYEDQDVGSKDVGKGLEIKVDKKLCIGCGLCKKQFPNIFCIKYGKAEVYGKGSMDDYKKAVSKCPASAVKYTSN